MLQIKVADHQLEYGWHGPRPDEAPTLVFLHEGLGCVAMWKGFAERVVAATGYGALVYSRAGYGKSGPCKLPRPVRFMHDEALIELPQVLDAFEIRETILVGHSDGGSIALIHAGGIGDARISGLVLLAPHVFVEEPGLESIRRIAEDYRTGNLRQRLQRYHGENVDGAFWGWNEVWLNPEFRSWNIEEYLPRIRVPVLLIQGADDQYGTPAQIGVIEGGIAGPAETVILKDCGHSPHLDQPEQTLAMINGFVQGIASKK
ncbi:MAG TPA: alpha/beta hydrolase [Pyrinomonadaceae bacterium]|nr:alpha/beta hydrolase [Pyrinomonadaceae bacterium]